MGAWVERQIFLSYRREDSAADTGRLSDWLSRELGSDTEIFMDVDDIPSGIDFAKYLRNKIQQSDAFLAVIGPNWLDARDEEGSRRLDDPNDFVRIEIGVALERDIPVIPILLNGTRMPRADQLPPELQKLPPRNAVDVRHRSFHADVAPMIGDLKKLPNSTPRFELPVPLAIAFIAFIAWGLITLLVLGRH